MRIALRYPYYAQALGDHCATLSSLRASPGWPSMATRGTHASRPWSPDTAAVDVLQQHLELFRID